ncbi:hypothetical protein BOTCAL_0983g00010 [Botryotinia calthae]|uniref:Uncharacterized protein n=1 Tax=Botryotinia calthae TaxID=38488 RepID=A0A4Y8CED4_9HELO|nr:hypothetical protein BOTCAL_0983g00010 [Botryotinia calthae]
MYTIRFLITQIFNNNVTIKIVACCKLKRILARYNLLSHLKKRYEKAKEYFFKDINTFIVFFKILKDILHNKSLKLTILIIDTLDEYEKNLFKLLRLIILNISKLNNLFLIAIGLKLKRN